MTENNDKAQTVIPKEDDEKERQKTIDNIEKK